MEIIKRNKGLVLIVAFFALLYVSISLVNHHCFRTYALDLGAYTNALYDYTHFQWNDSCAFKETQENLLADHFDLFLIFIAPFSLVLGSYTLLIVQIILLLVGGIGVFAYFTHIQKDQRLAICALVYFYTFFGVFAAFSFDYHSNVIAAALIPWFFYFIENYKLKAATLLLLLILSTKENISLWLVFMCLGLAFEKRKLHPIRNYLLLSALFCLISFIGLTSVIMPAISLNGAYPHFHYSILGNNAYEALLHLIKHPFDSFIILFKNHTGDVDGDFVKLELHLFLIASGIPLLIKNGTYFFMIIPIFAQKLFHDNIHMWGIGSQYSIEFAPIFTLGIFMVLAKIDTEKYRKILCFSIVIFSALATIRLMDNTIYFTDKSRLRFYKICHYERDYDINLAHKILAKIPCNAIVSAQSPFVPHLALRDNIYQFPIVKNAQYVVYSIKENYYPLSKIEFERAIQNLHKSKKWKILHDGDITVLQKIDY